MKRLLLLLCLVPVAAGCGSSDRAVAHVGGTEITRQQVDALVARAADEAQRERLDFPAPGSDGYRALQHQALGILVYRAQVETAARRRLGIAVTDAQARASVGLAGPRHKDLPELAFERTIGALGIEEGTDEEAALQLDDARLRLTLAALERRLGRDAVGPWVTRVQRDLRVDYAPGWGVE